MGNPPVIILVEPQLGENIGAAARAMQNFGLGELRLVSPRDGWPNPDAVPMASGATGILDGAKVYGSLRDATVDCQRVFATTARSRDMIKPVVTAREAGTAIREQGARSVRCAVLFGPERSGLGNDHVSHADTLIRIPTSPTHASINLAQSVLLLGYEWFVTGAPDLAEEERDERTRTATKDELFGLIEHLERELDERGFFYPPAKKPAMIRNLRNLWQRADLREQDVKTLRGVVAALVSRR